MTNICGIHVYRGSIDSAPRAAVSTFVQPYGTVTVDLEPAEAAELFKQFEEAAKAIMLRRLQSTIASLGKDRG